MKLTLQQVRIASPCQVSWDSMSGDDRVRFCDQCRLNVYNLSGMTQDEAQGVLERHEGRLCARIFQRADGTILTKDCPVGLAKVRAKAAAWTLRVAAAVVGLVSGAVLGRTRGQTDLQAIEPFATLTRWVRPGAPVIQQGQWLSGDVCLPAPNPAPGAAR